MEHLVDGHFAHESWREYADHSLDHDNLTDDDLIHDELDP